MLRKTVGVFTSPVFIVAVIFWAAWIWFSVAKDWVFELNQFKKEAE
jgi:hypothetical protein